MAAVVHGPEEGEHIAAGTGSKIVIKATEADTAGSFFLCESTIAPGFPGPPLHRHKRLHDMFYVLEGTLTVNVDGEQRELGPGSFACVAPGTAHTFSNPSASPVRFLNFNTPGGFEHYMRALGEAARSGPLTPEVMGPIASRYDFEPA
jgi:mannose-6-phosphate isomerase-like protein (cupin superfamily)